LFFFNSYLLLCACPEENAYAPKNFWQACKTAYRVHSRGDLKWILKVIDFVSKVEMTFFGLRVGKPSKWCHESSLRRFLDGIFLQNGPLIATVFFRLTKISGQRQTFSRLLKLSLWSPWTGDQNQERIFKCLVL